MSCEQRLTGMSVSRPTSSPYPYQETPQKSEFFFQHPFLQRNPMDTHTRRKGGTNVNKNLWRGWRCAALPKGGLRWRYISQWHENACAKRTGTLHSFRENPRYEPWILTNLSEALVMGPPFWAFCSLHKSQVILLWQSTHFTQHLHKWTIQHRNPLCLPYKTGGRLLGHGTIILINFLNLGGTNHYSIITSSSYKGFFSNIQQTTNFKEAHIQGLI